MAAASKSTAPVTHELVMTRVFAAPRELVIRAWTDQELLKRWSCPVGFVIEFGEADLRPGGSWRCGMRAPDGILHVASGVYQEITPPECLVFTHAWDNEAGQPGHESLITILLAERDGHTTMTFTQSRLKSAESREGHRGGWTEAFEKLDEIVNALTQGALA